MGLCECVEFIARATVRGANSACSRQRARMHACVDVSVNLLRVHALEMVVQAFRIGLYLQSHEGKDRKGAYMAGDCEEGWMQFNRYLAALF